MKKSKAALLAMILTAIAFKAANAQAFPNIEGFRHNEIGWAHTCNRINIKPEMWIHEFTTEKWEEYWNVRLTMDVNAEMLNKCRGKRKLLIQKWRAEDRGEPPINNDIFKRTTEDGVIDLMKFFERIPLTPISVACYPIVKCRLGLADGSRTEDCYSEALEKFNKRADKAIRQITDVCVDLFTTLGKCMDDVETLSG